MASSVKLTDSTAQVFVRDIMLQGTLLLKRFLGAAAVLTSLLAFSTAGQIFHDPRKKESVGFSVDLDYSADEVVSAVKKVANDTTIRGSRISTKDQAMEIREAEFAASSKIFGAGRGSDEVFYKVKKDAIAPSHFPGSNGEGTVAVRYMVQALTPGNTHLSIDAVFFQESLHARYFSDGSVESVEFAQILVQLKALRNPRGESSRSTQLPVAEADSVGLQNTLADLQARLADANAAEQASEKRIERLKFNTQGQIKTEAVPLKVLPYNLSSTILTLAKGEAVTVLATSKYWYHIRTQKGEEGWIYYVFLGPLS